MVNTLHTYTSPAMIAKLRPVITVHPVKHVARLDDTLRDNSKMPVTHSPKHSPLPRHSIDDGLLARKKPHTNAEVLNQLINEMGGGTPSNKAGQRLDLHV